MKSNRCNTFMYVDEWLRLMKHIHDLKWMIVIDERDQWNTFMYVDDHDWWMIVINETRSCMLMNGCDQWSTFMYGDEWSWSMKHVHVCWCMIAIDETYSWSWLMKHIHVRWSITFIDDRNRWCWFTIVTHWFKLINSHQWSTQCPFEVHKWKLSLIWLMRCRIHRKWVIVNSSRYHNSNKHYRSIFLFHHQSKMHSWRQLHSRNTCSQRHQQHRFSIPFTQTSFHIHQRSLEIEST